MIREKNENGNTNYHGKHQRDEKIKHEKNIQYSLRILTWTYFSVLSFKANNLKITDGYLKG